MKSGTTALKSLALCATLVAGCLAATLGCGGEKAEEAPKPININKKYGAGSPPPPPMKNGAPVEGVGAPAAAPPMSGSSTNPNGIKTPGSK